MSRAWRITVQYVSIAVLTLIDQLINLRVEAALRPVSYIPVIDGFISLSYVQNTGMAFSMLNDRTNLLSVVTGIMIAAGLVYLAVTKDNDKIVAAVLPCIIAGGLGNLLDRLIRGYVTDFIKTEFVDFAVFNFADILVTCGVFVLAGRLIFLIARDSFGKKEKT